MQRQEAALSCRVVMGAGSSRHGGSSDAGASSGQIHLLLLLFTNFVSFIHPLAFCSLCSSWCRRRARLGRRCFGEMRAAAAPGVGAVVPAPLCPPGLTPADSTGCSCRGEGSISAKARPGKRQKEMMTLTAQLLTYVCDSCHSISS